MDRRPIISTPVGPRSHQKTSQISAEASQLCVGAGDRCSAVQEDGDTRSKHLELLFYRLHPADQPPSPDRGLAGRAPSAETREALEAISRGGSEGQPRRGGQANRVEGGSEAARPTGLDRFALPFLPSQPRQPQLVMHPHQRVRLHSLLVIGQDELCAPRPVSRMPPLQEPAVSVPVRCGEPLPHRSGSGAVLGGAGGGCALLGARNALRACLDPGQRLQIPNRARACSGR